MVWHGNVDVWHGRGMVLHCMIGEMARHGMIRYGMACHG